MPHIEEIQLGESEAAERDRLFRLALPEVQPEKIEDVEKGFPIRFALELLGDHGLEELLRFPWMAERFEEPGGDEITSAARVRPRMAGAQRFCDLEHLKRLADLAHLDEAVGADALGEPAKHRVVRGNHGKGFLRERQGALRI